MRSRRRFLRCCQVLAVFTLIGMGTSVRPQEAARPDRGTMPNRSYSVSDIENISLQNGNVNLSIPLAALPPIAGGKLSWVVNANYNSKIWDVTRYQENEDPLTWAPYAVNTPGAGGGWTVGATYQMQFRNSNDDFYRLWYPGNSGLPEWELNLLNNFQWRKVVLRTPDGAEHEFRPTDHSSYTGSQDFLRGFYNVTPNGSPMRYYSVDGTYMFARITSNLDWSVYMPDGTQIIQTPDGIQRIQDTNGNKIKIFSDANGTHYQDEQTGREIRITYNPAGLGQYQIWYKTVGGIEQHIDINLGTTTVQGKLYSVTQPGCEFSGLTQVLLSQLEVVREIVFPQTEPGQAQRKFVFSYNSDTTTSATDTAVFVCPGMGENYTRTVSYGLGELSRVVLPSEAVVDYSYNYDGVHSFSPFGIDDHLAQEVISQKKITHDGTFDTWTYTIGDSFGAVQNADGSIVSESKYCALANTPGCSSDKAGLSYRTAQPFSKIERHWTNLLFSGFDSIAPGGLITANPVVDKEYTTLTDAQGNNLLMSARAFTFDYNGNVTQTIEYDWFDPTGIPRDAQGVPTGIPAGATVLRVVNSSHYNQATGSSSGNVYAKRSVSTGGPLILNAPEQTTVGPSIVQFSFDGQSFGVAPTVGNLTSKSVWVDVDNKWITTSSTYGLYGNLATTTDGRGKVTTFGYDNPALGLPNHVTVDPQNGTGTQTTTTAYDTSTGLVISTTDPNGNISTIDYTNQLLGAIDPFGRPGRVYGPDLGSGVNQLTKTFYADASRTVTVLSDLNSEGDGLLKSQTISDMLGRTIESRQYENATNFIAVRRSYDIPNRLSKTSNPFRAGEAVVWTTALTDVLGRTVSVTTPDNAVVTTAYDANFTTVTDQAGKVRRSVTDALGRLIRVDEPDGSGNLGATTSPVQPTSYEYDVFGNLRHVYQGTQTRTFTYDSLSRLRTAQNPESGTITYAYDDNGNLLTKVDARSITSNYVYDSLNRVTSRTYSDGTPAVTYVYDTLVQNGKGRLTSVSSSVSSYSYGGYDAMGRALGATQTIGSQNYVVSYTYNLAGHVKTIGYPSGRAVTYNYDNAGRLADKDAQNLAFTGNLGDGLTRTYSSISGANAFDAANRLQEEKFGTNTPLYNKKHYNVRGQLYDVRVSTLSLAQNEFDWNRGCVALYYGGADWGQSSTANNGNVTAQQHWAPLNESASNYAYTQQGYNYDSLNRLSSVSELHGSPPGQSGTDYVQAYSYDRWGNRTINSSGTWGTGINNLAFDTNEAQATNRLYAPGDTSLPMNQRQMRYDSAGNLTQDAYTGQGSRTYDAENRMISAGIAGAPPATYAYDGDGRRVKRMIGTTETWQVYGLGGELLAEYTSNGTQLSKEYGYRNGELLITATVTTGWGAPPSYTGPNPLSTGDQIKLENLTELRSAVNQLRQHAGLAPYNFTVDPNPQQNVTTVKADHIRQLRTALEEARTALGLSTGGYAHPTLTENFSLIYAVDFQELRNQVLSAWQSGGGVDIRWLVADHLGTPRMIFDQTGSLANVSRHDYLPFGEELFAEIGGRTPAQGYPSGPNAIDGARQRFTQKERDNETGLDYFQARYYSSTQGRFASIDPENYQARLDFGQPQSWNAYSYVNNNPVIRVDPDGKGDLWERLGNLLNGIGPYTNAEVESIVCKWRGYLYEKESQYGTLVNCENGDCTRVNIAELSNTQVLRYSAEFRLAEEENRLFYYPPDQISQMVHEPPGVMTPVSKDSQRIADGHSWTKHQKEFLGWDKGKFTQTIDETIKNAKGGNVKNLSSGRTAYWNEKEKMVVIRDAKSRDGGTAFRPTNGRAYFDNLK